MADVKHIVHDGMCCDESDRPHVHIEGHGDTYVFRLGRWEWRGSEQAVMEAVDEWLQREGLDDE